MRSRRVASDTGRHSPVSTLAVFVGEFLRRLEREFRVFARHQFRRVHFFDFPRTFDDLFESVRVVVLREGVPRPPSYSRSWLYNTPAWCHRSARASSALFLLRKDLRLIIASSMSSIGLLLLLLSFDKVVGPHLRSDDVRAVRELRHEYRVRFPERLIVMLLRRGKRELLCLGAEICCGCRRVLVSRRKTKPLLWWLLGWWWCWRTAARSARRPKSVLLLLRPRRAAAERILPGQKDTGECR